MQKYGKKMSRILECGGNVRGRAQKTMAERKERARRRGGTNGHGRSGAKNEEGEVKSGEEAKEGNLNNEGENG